MNGCLRRSGGVALPLLLGLLVGCSSSEPEVGSVSGKVTFRDKALPGGTVTFVIQTDKGVKMGTASIQSDGTYTMNQVALGKAKVTVETETQRPLPGKPGEPEKKSATFVPIPAKYGNPERSGLTYEVKSGSQTHNISLK